MFNIVENFENRIEQKELTSITVYTDNDNIIDAINSINLYGSGLMITAALKCEENEVALIVEGKRAIVRDLLQCYYEQKTKGITCIVRF